MGSFSILVKSDHFIAGFPLAWVAAELNSGVVLYLGLVRLQRRLAFRLLYIKYKKLLREELSIPP